MTSPTVAITERAAKVLGRRLGRRNFLTRTALVGSALAVAPIDYPLKPGTAYAAICSCSGYACDCGATCCDGYTEFCCTLNGHNRCPPGTLPAGWWKVDGSSFCGGGARYYFDCNAPCGGCGCGGSGLCSGACSGTGCGCANGSCGNRKAGCTMFRYGQCNQHIACLGPIVCRVVTCTVPWQLEPTCTATVAVDNNTRNHDRPCLHAPVGGLDVVQWQGNQVRVAGWALDPDTTGPIHARITRNGATVATVLANQHRSDVAAVYPGMGPNHGFDTLINVDGGQICAFAVNTLHGTGDTQLGCVNLPSHSPFGSVDIKAQTGPGQFRVAGWAIDPDTASPINVHIYLGPHAANVVANQSRPDVGAANPGYGNNHGFNYTFTGLSGTHNLTVYGINVSTGTNTILFHGPVTIGGSPFGSVDAVDVGPETIRMRGWAIDPDTASPIQVHAYVDGVGANITANLTRSDLLPHYPAYGANHGFDHTFSGLSGGSHNVAIWAINTQTGANVVLYNKVVGVPSGDPFGAVDGRHLSGPGQFTVRGWAIDPDTTSPIHVHAHIGSKSADIVADQARPDLLAHFPSYGANHGFDHTLTGLPAGTHTLSVFAIDVGAGGNVALDSRSIRIGGNPYGALDVVQTSPGRVTIRGWAIDPDTADPIQVHAYLDGQGVNLLADLPRPDLAASYPGFGTDHGFEHTFTVTGGQHTLGVFAINVGSGANTILADRLLTTPGGDPFGSVDVKQAGGGGQFTIGGWAIDPDTADPIHVHAYLGNIGIDLVADQPRNDLVPHYPAYGPNHGFSHTFSAPPGNHWLSIFAIDVGQGSTVGLASQNVLVV